jgi:uncharacterized protein YbjT (DUF2867 family)
MTKQLTVLVIGATGQQGGAVARQLLRRGHQVRAFTRKRDSVSAQELKSFGAELAIGNIDDHNSVARAAEGVEAIYSMSTFFEAGIEAEVRQGKTVADAAKATNVPHLVHSSVGGANQATGIPHFESKFQIEEHVKSLDIPYTIIAPVYFMENAVGPWSLPGLVQGSLAMSLPANRRLQQISVPDIAAFATYVIENREKFLGKRFDIASDELDGVQSAEIISRVTGRETTYFEVPLAKAYEMSEDVGKMYEWFDTVGYSADIESLRRDYPEVGWQTFEEWARTQDWSALQTSAETAAA